jgi:2-oxoacid:acceptor oxidoreductase delta subunit (pyruvate/2-ketoisovalerate family)
MPSRFGPPRISVSRTSTLENRTGAWKYIRPLYRDGVAPCNQACPAGVDVEGYLNLLRQDRIDEALDLLLRENPMPAVTGRVCHHPCEIGCNRRHLDDAIAVHAIERAMGDRDLARSDPPPPHRVHPEAVAIVGAGPAGLSAAYHLVRLGYGVTVYDEAEKPGGMLRQGIPAYRLPREVLDRQIQRIASMGVEFRTGIRLEGDLGRRELRGYDAVLLATGAHRSRPLGVPGADGPGIMPGLEFLKAVNRGERPDIGHRVAVIGGGNTAMDCARTALRLGSDPVVVYRRTREEMPAIATEIDEAMAEGIELVFLAAPESFHHQGGRLRGMHLTRMELGEPDETGRRRPVPLHDGGFALEVDTVLVATGEEIEPDVLPEELGRERGAVEVDELGATGMPTFFAGGDLAGTERTVADALGSGKRAAMGIDRHFRGLAGESRARDVDALRWGRGNVSMSRWRGDDPVRRANPTNEVVDIEALQTAHFAPAPRPAERWRAGPMDFGEVNLGIDFQEALAEAKRCFNCGVCNDCEVCLIFCPDAAIRRRPEGGFEVDLDYCKGCGICAEECPRGAIVMTREGL